jgi:uncharacterized protein (DUF1501 family)
MSLSRRLFLKSGGVAMASFAATPSFLARAALGKTGITGVQGRDEPIIIAIFQRGAADGVSMVVPFGDRNYYTARPQLALAEPSPQNSESAIDLDGYFGLHPALRPLKSIYDHGNLAIVHAVGSPNSTRSHFDAQDYMESGTPGRKSASDGWLNRYLQRNPYNDGTPFRAVALSSNMPRTLLGPAPAVALTRISDFGVRAGNSSGNIASAFEAMYGSSRESSLHETGQETFEAVKMLRNANPSQYSASNGAEYPASQYGQALLQIAQLVKAEVGLQVAFADVGGWDTHANQGGARGQLAIRLADFGQGLAALYRDLGDRMRNIVVLTMTEFGRSIKQNGSGGTDHGHASCLFVAGGPVKGGMVYGKWPGLANDQLYEGRDLALTTDFRDVFSEILVRHMGARDVSAVFPDYKPSQTLGFI